MSIEERIINLIFDANLETLKHWVDNDISLIQNLDEGDRLIFNLIAPILREMNLNADRIMFFLRKNRPDIYNVVTREWISKQLSELKGKV